MKQFTLLLTLLLTTAASYSQTPADIDSLTMKICKTLEEITYVNDSIRLNYAFDKHMPEFIKQHKIESEEAFEPISDKIFFRLQKNCNEFVLLLSRAEPPKQGEWKMLDRIPKNKLSKKECRELTGKKYYYVQSDGSKVYVTLEDGFWEELFPDGTYSKLYFRWKTNCEFEIEFIESNNHSRKNLSNKGDLYHYGMYNKTADGYEIWVDNAERKTYQSFILHKVD